jgi:hypothetical protein
MKPTTKWITSASRFFKQRLFCLHKQYRSASLCMLIGLQKKNPLIIAEGDKWVSKKKN